MHPAELFAASASLVDRVIAGVCRRARLSGADAEDFAGDVKLALLEDDFAILRKFEGRASLLAFLTVIVERLLFDQRTRKLGRWMPSAEAERMGDAGVLLEKLIRRDHRSIDEALPILRAAHPGFTRETIEAMAERLPRRTGRPRAVPLDEGVQETLVAADDAEQRALDAEARDLAGRASALMTRTLQSLPVEDRLILRFRYASSMSIADISRMTRLPQRPLYRRMESLLRRLRAALAEGGVDAATAADLIGRSSAEMDFGLGDTENGATTQSTTSETPVAEEAS
jgi:RNA polymerase sigma factor (sigma-70 family)